MDVKIAFLNGNLQGEVYITQLDGFTSKTNTNQVCRQRKSIYKLKQPSQGQNIRFDEAIKEFGFIMNPDDPCIYKKMNGQGIGFFGAIC